MTPNEYLKIKAKQDKIIKLASRAISSARYEADKCKPPTNRRPACAGDIVTGAVIWHIRDAQSGGDYWNIVDEPLHYGDDFKAYVADDGCRYGLFGAYVEAK